MEKRRVRGQERERERGQELERASVRKPELERLFFELEQELELEQEQASLDLVFYGVGRRERVWFWVFQQLY